MDMDMWKYFGITHTDHTVMDPMSLTKTRELIDLLRLPDGGRVLDVACGKAEFLCFVAEQYGVTGTGIELSPVTFEEAQKNVSDRELTDRIELLNMDGGKYEPDRPESHDLASCIGGSWIYQGHRGTLEALRNHLAAASSFLGPPRPSAHIAPRYACASATPRSAARRRASLLLHRILAWARERAVLNSSLVRGRRPLR